ncbi:MAG: RNA 2',3'-cyclic phosphodiesterase [Candidatus Bathyarchaeota archaeon]|nr:RNA 2',3'-cyclic phosphodiesterase [Candidatus Bathyarchaeota archaeon]MDH5713751.1 RNA 2',3'-cyclic phosphodiesterase [Candidatus Bathyarchaeota archaeon]
MSQKIRSFIAFDINNESVLNQFSEVQGTLLNTGADLKLVKPQNIHVTMRFLGNISLPLVDLIHEEMEKLTFTSFNVEIKGLGAFPSLRYARVVWAGIRNGADELVNIFDQLEPRLRGLGFRPDSKGFSPHLTIARVKTGRNKSKLVRCIQDLVDYEFGVVRADCLRLKKSVLTPRGPIYSTLREVCR